MMTESEAVKTLAVVAGSRIFPKFREIPRQFAKSPSSIFWNDT